MAIIELNLEKPALKRVESGEKATSRSGSTSTRSDSPSHRSDLSSSQSDAGSSQHSTGESSYGSDSESSYQSAVESDAGSSVGEQSSDESGGKSRIRKYGRRMAVLGGTAAGVAAARKLRQRRKSDTGQQELEEDWQTAEPTSSSVDDSSSEFSES